MKQGDVFLTPLPQADGIRKNRPAIYLRTMPPYGDVLACGVSTQLHQEVKDFDMVIGKDDADFDLSGLAEESLIRLGFLSVIPQSRIIGTIGSIAQERHRELIERLISYLLKFED